MINSDLGKIIIKGKGIKEPRASQKNSNVYEESETKAKKKQVTCSMATVKSSSCQKMMMEFTIKLFVCLTLLSSFDPVSWNTLMPLPGIEVLAMVQCWSMDRSHISYRYDSSFLIYLANFRPHCQVRILSKS